MNDQWNDNETERPEEPERVFIPFPQTPEPEPRPGGGSDTTALIFSILSIFFSSCLPPISVALSILSFVFLRRYRAAGGEWRGTSIASALLAALGILFAILSVILVVLAFVSKDPDSIYGLIHPTETT